MTVQELRRWGQRPAPLWMVRAVLAACAAGAGVALALAVGRLDLAYPALVASLVLAWLFGVAAGGLLVAALWRPWDGGAP